MTPTYRREKPVSCRGIPVSRNETLMPTEINKSFALLSALPLYVPGLHNIPPP